MNLEQEVIDAIRSSGQSRYERGRPNPDSIPVLEELRTRLRALSADDSGNTSLLFMLADVEECLLNYGAAIECLENIVALGGAKTKSIRKRIAILSTQSKSKDRSFPFTESDSRLLRIFLENNGVADLKHRLSLEHTENWLNYQSGLTDWDQVIPRIEELGINSDFELLMKLTEIAT